MFATNKFKTIILTTLITSCVMVCMGHEDHEVLPRLLLISFDGFRWDYLKIVQQHNLSTPTFNKLIAEGVSVASPGVKNSFITKTIPDHYTIVTGLYQEVHGVIANTFYDPVFNENFDPGLPEISTDIKWWNGTGSQKVEPIWVTNEAAGHGRASGAYMWWGCATKGLSPSYFKSYNGSVSFEKRADVIVDWFTEHEKPINFGALYMSEPDHTGHFFGPESEELVQKVVELDKNLQYMLEKLESKRLLHGLNIIITSDHGMEPVEHNIFLYKHLNSSLYMSYGGSPIRHFIPKPGFEKELYAALKTIKNATVFKKDEFPEELHYKNNRRVAPYILVADVGFQLCDDPQCSMKHDGKNINLTNLKGEHGWNNSLPSMHPIFIAHGPAFKKNFVAEPFETVDIYELMCHLLDIQPRMNNGSLNRIKHILTEVASAGVDNLNITMITFLFSIGFAALISGIWCIGACRSHRYSRRNRSNGRWKPLQMGTIAKTSSGNKPLLIADDEEEDLA